MTAYYNDNLDPEDQVEMEEEIAGIIFNFNYTGDSDDEPRIHEEAAADLGREILLAVLERFRPDLIDDGDDGEEEIQPDWVTITLWAD